jgi:hypothetical protein
MAVETTPRQSERNRPLLTRGAVAVHAAPDVDEEFVAKLKTARWTDAGYTQGPNGTVVDTPAGLDTD